MTNIIKWIKGNRLKSVLITLLLIPAIYILYTLGIFGFISYIDRYAYDTDYSKLPKPYSQRGEPLPPTDVPVTLPPDPGEAGKKTLAGIDSNNDGVRDDLEREIVYMYPQNEEVRRVLRAMVKKEQDLITTTGDHEYFKNIETSSLAFLNCYNYLVFGTHTADHSKSNLLINLVRNTDSRLEMARKNAKTALPYSSPIYFSSLACTQPLVNGKY